MLKIKEFRGEDAINTLCEKWKVLFNMCDASPFLSWEWIATWYRWINYDIVPYILCAHSDDDKLVGLLALGEKEQHVPLFHLKVRRLSFLGEDPGGADYLDILSLPGFKREVASAIFDYLIDHVSFDLLDLDSISEDSPNLPLLMQKIDTKWKFRYRFTTRFVCPQVKFESDWADVLKQSKRADNFKRKLKQLRNLEGFEYRTVTHPEEVDAAFERFLILHEARWESKGGSEATGHEVLRDFHRDVVKKFAHAGLLWFDELWVEGACRASIYGLKNRQRYYYYNSGYDQNWKNKSPGLVLLGLSLENAIKQGIKIYDFLRGDEKYKFDWANTTCKTAHVQVFCYNPSALLFIAYERAQRIARTLIRVLLPESVTGLIRRWQRSWRHRKIK